MGESEWCVGVGWEEEKSEGGGCEVVAGGEERKHAREMEGYRANDTTIIGQGRGKVNFGMKELKGSVVTVKPVVGTHTTTVTFNPLTNTLMPIVLDTNAPNCTALYCAQVITVHQQQQYYTHTYTVHTLLQMYLLG